VFLFSSMGYVPQTAVWGVAVTFLSNDLSLGWRPFRDQTGVQKVWGIMCVRNYVRTRNGSKDALSTLAACRAWTRPMRPTKGFTIAARFLAMPIGPGRVGIAGVAGVRSNRLERTRVVSPGVRNPVLIRKKACWHCQG